MSYEKQHLRLANKYPAISDLVNRAQNRIPKVAWEYLSAGTGNEELIVRNKEAFKAIRFLPQFCKGELQVDLETSLFGKSYSAPIGVAPVGLTGLMWPRVEEYLAASAKRGRFPYSLSTVATETPETVGKVVGDMGWFQLYPPKSFTITKSLLQRAKDSGFHTLLITSDVPIASRRERTKRAGLAMPPKITPKLIWEGMKHPSWSYHTLKRGLPRLRTVESYTNNTDMALVSGFVGNRFGGINWDYYKQVKDIWDGPVVIKGILHPADALKAIEIGLDGIGVTNHGARQFDGGPASIEALPLIVDVVKKRVPIIFDSGIDTGLNAMRALYLGADFVLAGRAFISAVAAIGEFGGDHAFHILTDGLINNMTQLGVSTIEELRRADVLNVAN